MPNRMLHEKMLYDDRVNALSGFEERVYVHLLLLVDDYGNVDANPTYLRNMMFPLRSDVEAEQVMLACARLCELGLIRTYAVDGRGYFHYTDFETNQKLKHFHEKYPRPQSEEAGNRSYEEVLEQHHKKKQAIISEMGS